MNLEIQTMIRERVLEFAPMTPSFISPLFIIRKNNGKNRVIFNLKALNQFMKPEPFHLFHHYQMPKFLQQGDWMVKLDISQAYYHVPISVKHRCFLRVSYKGRLLQMTCLPFGLAIAPKMFASVTNWTAELLRRQGLRVIVFLDDYLLVHQDREVLQAQVHKAMQFLQNLGWNINSKKSICTPTRLIDFLGITWDTNSNRKFLPTEKINKIRQCLSTRLSAGNWTLKQAQCLLGYLNFATFITHRGRLHCRTLQQHSNALMMSPIQSSPLAEEVRQELAWWLHNIDQKTAIHLHRSRTNYLTTDASDVQWGALVNSKSVRGHWTPRQMTWHCNLKEMHAVIAAILSDPEALKDSKIILQSDSKTVVSYIKNEGGTKSKRLLAMTKELLALTDSLNIVLIPHHLPGMYNMEADHLSRNRKGGEWHLLPEASREIFNLWGTPEIDLFASKEAHVVENYVTLDLLDWNACYHDAFSRSWKYDLAWIFPPPALLPQVLHHLNSAQGSYDTRSRQNSNQHRDTAGSASSVEITNGSMVNFGWDSLIENWSNDEKNLLSTCWRQSTRKTYAPIWKKWVKWCQENNLDYQFPAPTNVARYLARLFLNDHLAYRSILVHKSVIASICETLSDVKISSNNLVKHLLKAISIAKPIPQKLPIWDARTVIHYLRDSSPNENSLFDVSKRTATILLLTSGRRVHDLTLLHCDPQHFIDKGDSIILHPVFGSKTDTGSYRQTSWTLLDCPDKRLNPLFWLRTLVEVSKFTRGSLTNLFITTRDPVKPATTTIIGGWVKKVLSESGIEASPGSCRSAVASLNFLEKYPINEILAKANWRHEQTFKRYYCRNVESNTQSVETHSLSQYFKPSDD
ncbi:unnamed protein product [Leptosia nina]|uniref:Reverse transcriptase domain-containing protein n=1 Tax=Leptosia nina TaxID=320188 RepID=A0AAV1JQF6_9NEOP